MSRSVLLAAVAFLAFTVWSVALVPVDMDAFAAFHRIACWYPNAHWHTFREGCNVYALRIGSFEYFRSYPYIGITSSLFYYPLWKVWSSPASFLALGFLSLAAFSFTLARALRLPARCAWLSLCYFPIAFSMIHDEGPVRLSLLSAPLLVLLARAAVATPSRARRAACAVLAALIVFVCVEEKIFYLMLLPMVTVFVAACLWRNSSSAPSFRETVVWAAGPALLSGAGVIVLLSMQTGAGTYWHQLRAVSGEMPHTMSFEVTQIAVYSLIPPKYAHRVFDVNALVRLTAVLWVAAAIGLAGWCWRARVLERRTVMMCAGSYLVGAATFIAAGTPSSGHHFVFLHLPLIALLMVAGAANARAFAVVLSFVAISSLAAMGALRGASVLPTAAWERSRVFDYLQRPEVATQNVLNFSSWGGYYQQSLYGDREQIVTYSDPLTVEDSTRLVDVARQTSRGIVNVCMHCDRGEIARFFEGHEIAVVDLGLRDWQVFRIAVPPAVPRALPVAAR